MPFDLSLPLFAAFGLALGAVVTYFGWPRIHLRTYNKTHGDLRVVELDLILSRPARRPAVRPQEGGLKEASDRVRHLHDAQNR